MLCKFLSYIIGLKLTCGIRWDIIPPLEIPAQEFRLQRHANLPCTADDGAEPNAGRTPVDDGLRQLQAGFAVLGCDGECNVNNV